MKTVVAAIFIITISLLASCTRQNPDKSAAIELMHESAKIAQNSSDRLRDEDIMGKLSKLNERKMSFPQHRAEIEEETSDLQSFFQASIEDDQRMIEIYQKLLSFNLEPKEAECFRLGMRVQSNQIERTESMLDQMRLVFDKNIQDKETLERRTQNIEEKNRPLDFESSELEREMSTKCSKSNLGAN